VSNSTSPRATTGGHCGQNEPGATYYQYPNLIGTTFWQSSACTNVDVRILFTASYWQLPSYKVMFPGIDPAYNIASVKQGGSSGDVAVGDVIFRFSGATSQNFDSGTVANLSYDRTCDTELGSANNIVTKGGDSGGPMGASNAAMGWVKCGDGDEGGSLTCWTWPQRFGQAKPGWYILSGK
jgi:hypothetical protein